MKAIALIRVSTISQDLQQQTDVVINHILADGYNREDIILVEDKESAVKLGEEERLGLTKMKQLIEGDSSINAVYVFELSRLSRRPEVLYSVRDFLLSHKVQLVVLKPYMKLLEHNGSVSNTSSIMFAIFGALAEQEGYIRKERLQRGVKNKKTQGKYAGGKLLFGYTADPKTKDIIIDEIAGPIVVKMFNMYVHEDYSTVRLAKYFYETGELHVCDGHATVQTAVTTIRSMLMNVGYIGGARYDAYTKKHTENIYPRLISDEVFNMAQKKLCKGKIGARKRKFVHFCKGLIKDSHGNTYTAVFSHNHYKVNKHYFDGTSYHTYAPMNLVDSIIWQLVKEYKTNTTPTETKQAIDKITQEISTLRKKVKTAEAQIREFEAKIIKINERIISGKLKDAVGDAMIDNISEQIKVTKNQHVSYMFEVLGLEEERQRLKDGKKIDLSSIDDYAEIAEVIKSCVTEVILDRTESKGIYNLSVTFRDNSWREISFNSFTRKAVDLIEPRTIEYKYFERTKIVVKDGVKKNVIVC